MVILKKSNWVKMVIISMVSMLCFSLVSPVIASASNLDDQFISDQEINKVARELEELFTKGILIDSESYSMNTRYLKEKYTEEEISGFNNLLQASDLKNNSSERNKRSLSSFAVCMKDKAVAELKDLFSVGKFLVFLEKKAWQEAAKFAVKWLAKNGLKRNVAATAALLGWYGVQCAGH